MPKVRLFDDHAVAAARGLLAKARVEYPDQIDVEALALGKGVPVRYCRLDTTRATIVRSGPNAVICIDERLRGRPVARFAIAHELAHYLLHADVDHFEQCLASEEPRDETVWRGEREANDCASEILIPEPLGAPFCSEPHATVEAIDRLARAFTTSFEMSAIRMTELTMAPCAVVVTENGRVKWALESLTFPGTIAPYRPVHPESGAARLAGKRRREWVGEVPGGAWKSGGGLVEQAWRVGRGKVVSWVTAA
jgi:Zn-dependent peptidase ImmA (M78 family)